MATPGYQPGRNDILNPVINNLPTGSEIHDIATGNDGMTIAAVVTINAKAIDPAAAATPLSVIYVSNTSGTSWNTDAYNILIHTAGWNAGGQVFNIVISPDDPSNWLVSTGISGPRELWQTMDAGQSWTRIFDGAANLITGETIRVIDISIDYGGKRDIGFGTVAAGGGRWATRATSGFTGWQGQTNPNGIAAVALGVAPASGVDYYGLKFSPTYSSDSSVALVYADTDATYYNVAFRDLNANATLEYAFISPGIEVKSSASVPGASPNWAQLNRVDLQLPSDFSGQAASLRRAYISLDAYSFKSATSCEDGIFRVDDATVYMLMDTTSISDKAIYSIAYFGTYASGKLLVGERMGYPCTATVPTWFTDSPTTCPIPCWYPALKPPTGAANQGTCSLVSRNGVAGAIMGWNADSSLCLCTTGSNAEVAGNDWWSLLLATPIPNDESAFSVTRNNGETWNQIGLIDTTIDWINDVTPSPDGTTIYISSANRADGSGCDEFDSVWRSSINPNVQAPLPAVSPIGTCWERIYCRATAGNCAIIQSDLPILRVVNNDSENTAGTIVAWAAQSATATTGGTSGVMAWSPDYGDYWANITPRLIVQDFIFSSSTEMYVLSPGGLVQRLPYTGTSWSTNLPSYSSGMAASHTIAVNGDTLLVGADAATNAAGHAVSVSTDKGVTWAVAPQSLPTAGNVHVAFDRNFISNNIIYAADDNNPTLSPATPHAPGSVAGSCYRNVFPSPTGWVNLMSTAGGAHGPQWWPHSAVGSPPHNVGQFGLVATNSGNSLAAVFAAHDNISLQIAAGPASPPVASAVCSSFNASNAMPEPGVDWLCFNSYQPSTIGTDSNDTVRFTLEPCSLKASGGLSSDQAVTLYAIDDEAFGQYMGSTTGYSPTVNPSVRGCLWSYISTISPPTVTNASGATSIMATTAILNGNLTSTGGLETTVHICGGTTDGGTDAWDHVYDIGVRPAGAFSLCVTGLTPNTIYHYRCYAENAAGSSWASVPSSFATQAPLGLWKNYWAGPGKDWFWFSSGGP